MFGSEILDVAIGLILLFLLLSLVCSSIKEAFETVFKYRARDLERGIREIFGDTDRTGLVAQFYKHPLVNALFRGPYNGNSIGNLPSYIPARTFALTVMDLFRTSSGRPGGGAASATAGEESMGTIVPPSNPVADIRAAVSSLPEGSNIRGALLPLIDAAGNDAVRVRRNIEDWYNGSMDRVSGWYKRRTQIIIACVGFGIAGAMNVDTVVIARYLNTNQTARSVMVAQVEARRRALAQGADAAKPGGSPTDQPSAADGGSIPEPYSSEVTDPLGWLERQGGIPLGWRFKPEPGQSPKDFGRDWRRAPNTGLGWLLKIAGILFTGFAVSLGAPFWFDVLNKVMVIRSTVKPDEKSPDEASKS